MDKQVIAIDFGTSNTYFTAGNTERTKTRDIQIHGNQGIPSAILFRGKSTPENDDLSDVRIGEDAINCFTGTPEEERRAGNYQFFTNFKPDIVSSLEARRVAVCFFKKTLEEALSKRINLSPEQCQVNVGVPSEADLEYRNCLREIMREAGWGDVLLIDEPIGALYDTLEEESISLSTLMSGLLVIDFGGGTCDFAYMKNGKVVLSWGDMSLGGRLFDDLFYQWLLDTNPDVEKRIEEENSDCFVRLVECREMKECFSKQMDQHPEDLVTLSTRRFGSIPGASWKDFLYRANHYKMSEALKKQCEDEKIKLSEKLQNGEVDLIQWFRDSLVQNLFQNRVSPKEIRAIVLAGGSSLWRFVPEICMEALNVSPDIISLSKNPSATISNGLAVYLAKQAEFKKIKAEIDAQLPGFKQSLIVKS